MVGQATRSIKTYFYQDKQPFVPIWELQKRWVQEIDRQERTEALLLLEHTPVYTMGRGSKEQHLLISTEECTKQGIDLVQIDRGGDITYHGPGQLVGYPLLNLSSINNHAHTYLRKLEEVLIQSLAYFGIYGSRKPPYTGVWVGEAKIAAIGVKFNRGPHSKAFITSHGFALNVSTDLDYFKQIIPCGIKEFGVTSMEQVTGKKYGLKEVAKICAQAFKKEFAQTDNQAEPRLLG